jgi:hypothetical protein
MNYSCVQGRIFNISCASNFVGWMKVQWVTWRLLLYFLLCIMEYEGEEINTRNIDNGRCVYLPGRRNWVLHLRDHTSHYQKFRRELFTLPPCPDGLWGPTHPPIGRDRKRPGNYEVGTWSWTKTFIWFQGSECMWNCTSILISLNVRGFNSTQWRLHLKYILNIYTFNFWVTLILDTSSTL